MDLVNAPFDVAIIGAGVVGCAIARELAKYELRCVLLEASDDVGTGTSKANTAILHTGFDAKPGTLEATLVRRGYELMHAAAPDLGIAIEPTGALLVAWTEEQDAALNSIAANASRNHYQATRRVTAAELYQREPHLGAGALAALEVPGESIICPFTPPLAFATQAVINGVALALQTTVHRAKHDHGVYILETQSQPIVARYVVNAAGLQSDTIDRLFGYRRFGIMPRRGELIVFDKLARPLLSHILLPVPTATTKGVLVAPTVFGNVLLGPTADDIDDKSATASTPDGIARLLDHGRRILPALLDEEVTALYVGLRAASEHSDYQIHFDAAHRYVCVGGIRSTGLSASLAIAEYVVAGLADAGLQLSPRAEYRTIRMPNLAEVDRRRYQHAISVQPDDGRIVCHCEYVSHAAIVDACRAVIPARTLDGLRRRTRALLGRCQGFYCLPHVLQILRSESGRSMESLLRTPSEDHR